MVSKAERVRVHRMPMLGTPWRPDALLLGAALAWVMPYSVRASELPAPYSVGPFIDPRDASSCGALGHAPITEWTECQKLVDRAHKTVSWGGAQNIPNLPAGCWYYYETGQADGISLTFNAAVSGQPTDFFRAANKDRFGFFCTGYAPPAPPIMPLTHGIGGEGQLSKCTRAEAETLDYMPTYNECYNLYVARGDFESNAQMRFFEAPTPYTSYFDKDVAKGWCFLLVLQLEFDDGSENQRGDMQFKQRNWFTATELTCADWYAPCYCRLPLSPSSPPPPPPRARPTSNALASKSPSRTGVGTTTTIRARRHLFRRLAQCLTLLLALVLARAVSTRASA